MRRALRGTILVFLMAVGAHPASADFRMAASPQPPTPSDQPDVSSGDVPRYTGKRAARLRHFPTSSGLARTGLKQAASEPEGVIEGFGAGVPLSFACRQILPKTLSVTYAQNVDPETPVTWTGGRPWAAVLRDALQPAGLKIVPHGTTIEIRK